LVWYGFAMRNNWLFFNSKGKEHQGRPLSKQGKELQGRPLSKQGKEHQGRPLSKLKTGVRGESKTTNANWEWGRFLMAVWNAEIYGAEMEFNGKIIPYCWSERQRQKSGVRSRY